MRHIIEQQNNNTSFEHIASGIVEAKRVMNEEIDPEMVLMGENKERLHSKMLASIEKSKGEVVRMGNVLRTEIVLKEIQQVAQLI